MERDDLFAFLKKLELDSYYQVLFDEGFVSKKDLLQFELSEQDLKDMGFKIAHKKKLLTAILEEKKNGQEKVRINESPRDLIYPLPNQFKEKLSNQHVIFQNSSHNPKQEATNQSNPKEEKQNPQNEIDSQSFEDEDRIIDVNNRQQNHIKPNNPKSTPYDLLSSYSGQINATKIPNNTPVYDRSHQKTNIKGHTSHNLNKNTIQEKEKQQVSARPENIVSDKNNSKATINNSQVPQKKNTIESNILTSEDKENLEKIDDTFSITTIISSEEEKKMREKKLEEGDEKIELIPMNGISDEEMQNIENKIRGLGRNERESIYELAEMCEEGILLEHRIDTFLSLYKWSSELGFSKASLKLATFYHQGKYLPKDFSSASFYYRKAFNNPSANEKSSDGNVKQIKNKQDDSQQIVYDKDIIDVNRLPKKEKLEIANKSTIGEMEERWEKVIQEKGMIEIDRVREKKKGVNFRMKHKGFHLNEKFKITFKKSNASFSSTSSSLCLSLLRSTTIEILKRISEKGAESILELVEFLNSKKLTNYDCLFRLYEFLFVIGYKESIDHLQSIVLHKAPIKREYLYSNHTFKFLLKNDIPRKSLLKLLSTFHYLRFQVNGDVLFDLGELCEKGEIFHENLRSAFLLYQCSAELGNLDAFLKISSFYRDGKFVEKDHKKALQFHQKASEKMKTKNITLSIL